MHQELVELVGRATDRLLVTTDRMTPQDVAGASSLPRWSRGHVLTHLAHNAEGLTRLILGSQAGHSLPMYASPEARNADIEAGASRPGAVVVSHVQLACATLDAAVRTVADWTVSTVFATVTGPTEKPLVEVLSMRLREVAIHHVDLGLAHGFDDEDPHVLFELVGNAAERLSLQSEDHIELLIGGSAVATIQPASPLRTAVVDLSGPAMLGWLTGRDAPRADLPQLPNWG